MKPANKPLSPDERRESTSRQESTSKLAAAQSLMVAQITRPLIEADALSEEPSSVRDEQFVQAANDLFKPSWSLSSVDRMELYNRQYWYRVLDSLLDDFPGLQAILGAEKFDVLVTSYMEANPSTSYSLRDLGSKLPNFIEANPQYTEPDQKLARQMAIFEWAAIEAFDNKRYPILPPNALSSSNPDELVLRLQPYITIMEADYALDDFAIRLDKNSSHHGISTANATRAHSENKTMRPKKKHVYIVVHRLQNSVYYKRVDSEQYCLLTAIKKGATLSVACEELAATLKDDKLATLPNRLREYFAVWMELNWFADPTAIKTEA